MVYIQEEWGEWGRGSGGSGEEWGGGVGGGGGITTVEEFRHQTQPLFLGMLKSWGGGSLGKRISLSLKAVLSM